MITKARDPWCIAVSCWECGQKWFGHKENFSMLAGPNLKKHCMTIHKFSSEKERSSLLAEELQHGSVPLPFERGEDECSSVRGWGGGDRPACRKKGWRGSTEKGKSGWLVELGAWMSFIRQQSTTSTPYSGSALEVTSAGSDFSIIQLESVSELVQGTEREKKKKNNHQTPRMHFYSIYSYPTVIRNKMPIKVLVLKKYFFIITVSVFWIMHMTFGEDIKRWLIHEIME